MATGMLNIGISGLTAAQSGLLTTGHNISNASTPGFSRQTIVQTTNTPQATGGGFYGQGTNVSTIKRVYSQFLANQVASAQARVAELNSYSAQVTQIDNVLADPNSGLSPALQDFFKSIQEVAANPSSIPARQSMLSGAQALVARFAGLDSRLNEIRAGIDEQIGTSVANINSLATQIANLNDRIVLARGASSLEQPPNDLYDQRDQLLADLNKEIRVTTTTNMDGSLNVFIGNGQPLVVATQTSSLQATQDRLDSSRVAVSFVLATGGSIQLPETLVSGGNLGGLLAFRTETLDPAQNALGRLAISLTDTFNAQHRLGQDLDGQLGGDFFRPATAAVLQSAFNTGTADVDASIADFAALTTSDYRLTATGGGNFDLVRLSDNVTVFSGNLAAPITVDGFTVSLAAGAANVGDSFLVQPTRTGARDIALMLADARDIAAAVPLRTSASLGNHGTGSISAGAVDSVTGLPLGNVTLTYHSGAPDNLTGFPNGVDVTVNDNGVVTTYLGVTPATAITFAAGATISFGGVSVAIGGSPADGDTFAVSDNPGAVADNRNALLLGNLQTSPLAIGGTATYQSAYSQIVSLVGNKAREVQVALQAQENLEKQASDSQQSLSGVNLDEEAANLLRYQQAYQASAKVIDLAGRLFDELLSIGR